MNLGQALDELTKVYDTLYHGRYPDDATGAADLERALKNVVSAWKEFPDDPPPPDPLRQNHMFGPGRCPALLSYAGTDVGQCMFQWRHSGRHELNTGEDWVG